MSAQPHPITPLTDRPLVKPRGAKEQDVWAVLNGKRFPTHEATVKQANEFSVIVEIRPGKIRHQTEAQRETLHRDLAELATYDLTDAGYMVRVELIRSAYPNGIPGVPRYINRHILRVLPIPGMVENEEEGEPST